MATTQTYKVDGMSCDGCRKYVEKILSKVENVKNVSADLEKGEVTIDMEENLPIDVFKKVFEDDGGSYQIIEG